MSDFAVARQNMVDCQVRPSDVTDQRIVDAMLAVPREIFVPAGRQAMAYLDLDIDVTSGGKEKRYIIKAAVLAKLLQAAAISSTDRVLIVGGTTGYSAAVIAHFAGQVVATDPDAAFVASAKENLAGLGLTNVTVGVAEPAAGDPSQGPYNVILIDGATEVEPRALYEQLAMDGVLVGVFATSQPPRATLVERSPADFGNRVLFDANAPVLPGLERRPEFVF